MKNLFGKIFILSLLLCFIPQISLAAKIFVGGDKNTFILNNEFLAEVYLDTENIEINAVEGKVIFPSSLLDVKEIREGNSIVNFWVEEPHSVKDGEISFSGITTGGFSGPKKFLFSIVFQSKNISSGKIVFNDVATFQNDGIGTKIHTDALPFSFTVIGGAHSSDTVKIKDHDIPEDFVPLISRDPSLFNGKYFIVFSTVDKGVGIDHYEIREGFMSNYMVVKSPYLLEDQTLSSHIYIKAIDKAGNKRVVEMKAQNSVFGLNSSLILGIILIICILLILHRGKICPKFTRS